MRKCLIVALMLALSACNLMSSGATPTPNRYIPTVQFQFPMDGITVIEGTDLQVQLVAHDPNGSGVAQVDLLVDDVLHQEASPVERPAVPIFTVDMNWLASGVGLHSMTAIAYRTDGTTSEPTIIRVNVAAGAADDAS